MEEFEKALKEFCEFQNITDQAAIAQCQGNHARPN
jgi:hypothetical protein